MADTFGQVYMLKELRCYMKLYGRHICIQLFESQDWIWLMGQLNCVDYVLSLMAYLFLADSDYLWGAPRPPQKVP